MKTKIYLLWAALLLSATVFAQSGTDGTMTWSLSNGRLTISGSGDMKNYLTTTPRVPWSSYKSQITSVNVQGVTSIGNNSFNGCTNLQSVTIGGTVTSIGSSAFKDCSSLKSVSIPNSVTIIANSAFSGCSAITTLSLGGNLAEIYDYAFSGCSGLTSVVIPNKVWRIQGYAFEKCTNLESVTIGTNLTQMGNNAFSGCTSLVTVNYNGTQNVIYEVTPGWSNLTSVVFGNGVKIIPGKMFQGCTKLTSIVIPNSVTTIQTSAFRNCDGLISVTLGNQLETIHEYAFHGCSKLSSIAIPSMVKSIGTSAFGQCTNLTMMHLNATDCTYISFALPNLIDVIIGSNVTNMSASTFSGNNNLTNITVSAGNTQYTSEEGVLFNKNKTVLIRYPEGKQGAYSTPDGISDIGEYAFSNCTGLTAVTIGSSVTGIGEYAFRNCTRLTTVTNFNPTPQSITVTVFYQSVLGNKTLIVPFGWGELYKSTDIWKDFMIKEDQVNIEVTDNSAEVSWPVLADTESYTLYLYGDEAHQNTLAVYHLDKEGNLLRSAATEETISFTIPGLSAGTDYFYELVSLDVEENKLRSSSSTFSTNIATSMKDAVEASKGIAVYPNPTTGMVYFETEDNINIKVYGSKSVLLQENFGKHADLSGYPTGLYFIKAGNCTTKVIKK